MNSIKKLLMAMTLLLSVTFASAQIKNKTTETVKINGNCGMCKKTIETAANIDKVAKVNWDTNTKTATVTYDTKKTNLDAILKRVADAGYDNEKFNAQNAVYDELHGCCQYDREASPKKAE
ncbi:heavy-metal-associated domain-containing protein [Flavobacterium sp. ZB4P13]|uniref:heavy-metal-associated domain-containing protein n=1 Tax=Flavobacterium sp. ZB4P13 TaxID=3401728 RepID=UPI003AAD87E5